MSSSIQLRASRLCEEPWALSEATTFNHPVPDGVITWRGELTATEHADYGLDAPGIVRTMGTTGFLLIIVATLAPLNRALESAGLSIGISFLLSAIAMIARSEMTIFSTLGADAGFS
jgi:hypothetical protein